MSNLLSSRLYDQDTFYTAFYNDLNRAKHKVIIESPFITTGRFYKVFPLLVNLRKRGLSVVVNTRMPEEHINDYGYQAINAVADLQSTGVQVLYTGKLHRKIAIIDDELLWEGSLNILSQNDSCEIMRRIESEELAQQMARFISLDEILCKWNSR